MANEKIFNSRIKLKRDTSSNWTSNNPVILNGEIILVDTAEGELRFKIGDGVKTYTELPFEDEVVRNLIANKSKVTLETWDNATNSISQQMNELVINKVKNKTIYEEMEAAGKIDENELYLIEDDENEVTQSDWNQNSESAPDYVKNRTHYIEEKYVSLLPATTETNSFRQVDFASLYEGRTCRVILDGTEYDCTAYYDSYGDLCLGDSRLSIIYDGETGEEVPDMSNPQDVPFFISTYVEDGWGGPVSESWYITYSDEATHTIEVVDASTKTTEYHTLDEKFIPSTIARKTELDSTKSNLSAQINTLDSRLDLGKDWNQNYSYRDDYIKNRTHWYEGNVYTIFESSSCAHGTEFTYFQHLFVDSRYIVTCDGVETNHISWQYDATHIAIGNGADVGHPENVTYLIVIDNDSANGMSGVIYFTDDTAAQKNFKLQLVNGVYNTLDENYISDAIVRRNETLDWNKNYNGNYGSIINRTHWEEDELKLVWEKAQVPSEDNTIKGKSFSLEVGQTYIVKIDDVYYEHICWGYYNSKVQSQIVCPALGKNLNDKYGYHLEYCNYLLVESGTYAMYAVFDDGQSHDVAIYQKTGEKIVHTLDEKYIPDTIARTSDVEELMSDKKDKDLIVTYTEGSHNTVTHSVTEINEVVNNGGTVKFQKDAELLNLLEITADFATFYIVYVNMDGKLQQKVIAISGNSVMLEQDDTYDYLNNTALTNALGNYYTKPEIDDLVLITVEDIDAICGGAIQYAEDVMF